MGSRLELIMLQRGRLIRSTARARLSLRGMASAPSDNLGRPPTTTTTTTTTHQERTANEPRAPDLHRALIKKITLATENVRIIDFQVTPPGPFKFKAGQWVDTFTPASEQAGGFSIVSSPASGSDEGVFSLAIQRADKNPAASWLWRAPEDLTDRQSVDVRIGGQFTFPPVNFRRLAGKIHEITFIAGGIGINPCLSILLAIRDSKAPLDRITLLYGIKSPRQALYLDTLTRLLRELHLPLQLHLFVSQSTDTHSLFPSSSSSSSREGEAKSRSTIHHRRMKEGDLDATFLHSSSQETKQSTAAAAAESANPKDTNLYYICGPAQMTDWAQEYLLANGINKDLVQTERWW